MKKEYFSPIAEELNIESESMLAMSMFETEADRQYSAGARGTWF